MAQVTEQLKGIPTLDQWTAIKEIATALVKSGLMPPSVKSPEAAAAVILKGWELGIPPMHALAHIVILQGKPGCSAELHLALLARGGVTFEWEKDGSGGEACIVFRRPNMKEVRGTFNRNDAKAAGLLGNQTWGKYEKNMLRARAITNGARMCAPDLLCGMSYTPEELGAEVDEDGNVVAVPDEKPAPEPAKPAARATKADKPKPAPEPAPAPPAPPAVPQDVAETAEDGLIDFPPYDPNEKPAAPAPAGPPATVTPDPEPSPQEPAAPDPANSAQNIAVICDAICDLEGGLHLLPKHITAGRIKYVHTDKLSDGTYEDLKAYFDRLMEYSQKAKK